MGFWIGLARPPPIASRLGNTNPEFALLFSDRQLAQDFLSLDSGVIRRAWITGQWERRDTLDGPIGPCVDGTLRTNNPTACEHICQIDCGDGNICGLGFETKKAVLIHQSNSMKFGHALHSKIPKLIISNQCFACGSTFATKQSAYLHVMKSSVSGKCQIDCVFFRLSRRNPTH